MNLFLHFFILLIDVKLKKPVTKLILMIRFHRYIADQYKTQIMYDEAVDDFLLTLNFVLLVCYE